MDITLIKIMVPALVAFIAGIAITPIITHYLYQNKVWKTKGGKNTLYGGEAVEFNKLKQTGETKTPRMGGIVIWGSVLITCLIIFGLELLHSHPFWESLSFISRSQTWIPIATLFVGAGIGLLNDFYDITHQHAGLRLRTRLLIITILTTGIGWWFYSKLGVDAFGVPFIGEVTIGWLIIPLFIFFTLGVYASGVIDGIDGLSGGVFASIFTAYTGVAIIQMQYDLAAFTAMLVGAIIAFLWFNIPPARFYMTETGSMALTLTLAVVAFMTDALAGGYGLFLFLIISFPLVATVFSNILQMSYRKYTGKKFFKIAPLHHHFEAIGWPSYKVTMRYWIISIICGIVGVIIASILNVS